MDFKVSPAPFRSGTVTVPGDKSISHRALMLGSIAVGRTKVSGFLNGEDCLATAAAMRALGVDIRETSPTDLEIQGVGLRGLKPPPGPLDLGNSGTAMRLMAGLLAGQAFDSVLTGDESLSGRPMTRIVTPLTRMGAAIESDCDGTPPLQIKGGLQLHGIHYDMPVASAQVKSSVLLAGLFLGDRARRDARSHGADAESHGRRGDDRGTDRQSCGWPGTAWLPDRGAW
jgi:3-phosphoshikimate 1-carboxyvinyltransferase